MYGNVVENTPTFRQHLFHEHPLDIKWYRFVLVEKYVDSKPFWLQTAISPGFWSYSLRKNRKPWLDNNYVNNLRLCDLEKTLFLITSRCKDATRHAKLTKKRSFTCEKDVHKLTFSYTYAGRNVTISKAIAWRSGMVVWRSKKQKRN